MTAGRPTSWNKELEQKAWDYIDTYKTEHDHIIPSIVGMCKSINIVRSTAYVWAKDEDKEFKDILEQINDAQKLALINGGLSGELNSTITKLVLGKHGFHDKQDTNLNAEGVTFNMTIGSK